MIRLIAAIDSQRGIATDSGIPWTLPGDSAYFREKTSSGLIVMGRATYEEIRRRSTTGRIRLHYDLVPATEGFRRRSEPRRTPLQPIRARTSG